MNLLLLKEFTKRDFTERYSGSALGVFWVFIWPLVNIFIYTVIFSKIMSAKLPGVTSSYSYGLYLIAGLVPWTAFSSTISRSCGVFLDKKNIISKIKISLPSFPLFIVLSESITFGITILIYLIFILVSGHGFSKVLIFFPFIFAMQQILAYSFGFFLATLTVFLRDIKEFVGIIMQIWFWFTPIVYVSNILPEWVFDYMKYNPAYYLIESYHNIFVFKKMPDLRAMIYLTIIAHILMLISYIFFKKLEKDVRDFI